MGLSRRLVLWQFVKITTLYVFEYLNGILGFFGHPIGIWCQVNEWISKLRVLSGDGLLEC